MGAVLKVWLLKLIRWRRAAFAVGFGMTAAITMCMPLLAIAQTDTPAPDAPLGDGWQMLITAAAALMTALLGGLRWGFGLLKPVIEQHVENEWVKGALLRLLSEINSLADLVGTGYESFVTGARKPDSPGGTEITQGEIDTYAQALCDKLAARYWGWDKLLELAKRIGLGDTNDEAKSALLEHARMAVARKLASDPRRPLAA